ncbi:MAG: aldose epimerase family protein [Planctomycetota bacterium]
MGTEKYSFGRTRAGTLVHAYDLVNRNGLRARVMTYGATLVEMHVPDRNGVLADVVLGFEDVSGYESERNQYFGCTTGRVANRIKNGRFTLDGEDFILALNNGPNHLHGGIERSLDKVVWTATPADGPDGPAVVFRYLSPDLEEGYPGNLEIQVTYTLTHDNELVIRYEASADEPTPVNLTNHAYWNLAGAGSGSVLDHELEIAATHYTPTDDTLIPTGAIAPVRGTPLDFTEATAIGKRLDLLVETPSLGYDHNFVLNERGTEPSFAARLRDPGSGRVLEILTTEPGIQLYSGNFLRGDRGKDGKTYGQRHALCLETQHFPDSVNHPSFPSVILKPGETYRQTTIHRFGVD